MRDLYRARWGEPSRRASFDVVGTDVEVYKWNPDANPEGVALYATIGASEVPLAGRDPAHRVEFFVGLLPAKDEVAKPLAMLGSYSVRENTALDHGHTVTFPELLWTGTGLRAFLVMRPLSDVLSTLQLAPIVHENPGGRR